ncbi:hypothetical protein ACFL4G_08640 [Thermodesulfobacteriota bacterium]
MKKATLIVMIAASLFTLSSCCIPTPIGIICFGAIPIPIPGADAGDATATADGYGVVVTSCNCGQ